MSPEARLREQLARGVGRIVDLTHAPCRTSAESAAARGAAGMPDAVGAKALVTIGGTGFSMLVIPGPRRLDNARVRALIGKFRFARPEEVAEATDGLEIGTIPPFGRPVFPKVDRLIVDEAIGVAPLIGFNAARLDRSVVMPGCDYLTIALPDVVALISAASASDTH